MLLNDWSPIFLAASLFSAYFLWSIVKMTSKSAAVNKFKIGLCITIRIAIYVHFITSDKQVVLRVIYALSLSCIFHAKLIDFVIENLPFVYLF